MVAVKSALLEGKMFGLVCQPEGFRGLAKKDLVYRELPSILIVSYSNRGTY
jgi:hypothetical protein